MTSQTTALLAPAPEAVRIRAHHAVTRRLGHWTTSRRFDVLASRAGVVLDLRSPDIEAGEIELRLDVDRTTVTLLVPDDAIVDHDEVRRVGRGRVKDWTGTGSPGGRRIRLVGETRGSEVRVHRSGIAILSAIFTRQFLAECRRARREARRPTMHDPGGDV